VNSDELLKRVRELEDRIRELEERLKRSLGENEGLREENVRLRKELEEWKRGHRERSKRRSSRAEGRRKGERKRPGRKAGHPGAFRPEVKPDRTVEHPLPERCTCGGCVSPTEDFDRTVVQDIPPVKVENVEHVARVGRCQNCGRRVVAPLPGAPTAGAMVAASQLGPNAHGMIVSLRFVHRMPMPQISGFLEGWFGLSITPGGIHHLLTRTRERSAASYAEIESRVQSSRVVGVDETGLRQDGVGAWVWLARTDEASLFRVELSRGSWVAEAMLGSGFQGVVCSDFYGVYTAKTEWTHAYCGAHTIREAKKVAEVSPNLRTEGFRDELCDWYARAKAAQKNGSRAERQALRDALDVLVTQRVSWDHPDVLRLAKRIDQHFEGVVYFLDHRSVPSDNNPTERDIRPFAVFRKVTGGTRSEAGSKNAAHWMSVTQTLRKNDLSVRAYVNNLYYAHLEGRPPPSVFKSD
jgi:transposase